MSNALKNVAESTANTLSELVDEARTRIEDLPPLARGRRKRSRRHWSTALVVASLGLMMVMAARRRHHADPPQTDSTGDRRKGYAQA